MAKRRAGAPAAVLLAAGLFGLAAAGAFAHPQDSAPRPVTRAEFAGAYLKFETALRGARLSDAEAARVNKEFDALTLAFFMKDYARAMSRLNALTDSLGAGAVAAAPVKVYPPALYAAQRPAAEALLARLSRISAGEPALAQALAAVRARVRLLSEPPSPENTAQLMQDPVALAAQVSVEVGALEKGADPFKGRTGDYWRVVRIGGSDVPVRVYLAPGAAASGRVPLVVAFHGAGGDENMFMDGYGAGLAKELAGARGFLLVTPATYPFMGDRAAASFDTLVEALSWDYPVDADRIYVFGHSLGGVLSGVLAAARPGTLAAAACLSGFQGFKADAGRVAPTLIVAAELDPISPPARIEPAFKRAAAAGLPVEYRFVKSYGHTLTVARVLPDVVDWLLARRRAK
jgi:predicted esterase